MCQIVQGIVEKKIIEQKKISIKAILGVMRIDNPLITFEDFYSAVLKQEGYKNTSKEIVEEVFYEKSRDSG